MSDTLLDRFASAVSERSSPILVKEVRQGLRGKTFWITFSVLLAGCALIALSVLGDRRPNGAQFFAFYLVGFGAIALMAVPYSAFRSMSADQRDDSWVLLTLTGISPRRILWGKISSYLVQGGLFTSTIAPFLVFCYLLNGIEIWDVLWALGLVGFFHVALVVMGVAAATFATSRAMRGLLNFVALSTMFSFLTTGFGVAVAARGGLGRLLGSSGEREALLVVLFVVAAVSHLAFELAVARLKLPTVNYARAPRLTFAVYFLLGLGLAAALSDSGAYDARPFYALAWVFFATLYLAGAVMLSDADGMAPVLWRRARGPWLLKPGALRGGAFISILIVVTLLGFGVFSRDDGGGRHALEPVFSLAAVMVSYLCTAVLLSGLVAGPGKSRTNAMRTWSLVLVPVGALISTILSDGNSGSGWNVINPIWILELHDRNPAPSFAVAQGGVALILSFLAFTMLATRDRASRPA